MSVTVGVGESLKNGCGVPGWGVRSGGLCYAKHTYIVVTIVTIVNVLIRTTDRILNAVPRVSAVLRARSACAHVCVGKEVLLDLSSTLKLVVMFNTARSTSSNCL